MTSQIKNSGKELYLEYTLRLTKSRIRVVDVLSAGLLMLAILIVILLSMVLCDHYITGGISANLRRMVRWGLLVFEAGLAGALIIWPMLRRINDLYVARMIERANPRLRDELTATLQLAEDPAVHPGALAALRRRANSDTARSDTKSAVNFRGLKLSAVVLGAALVAFASYCYFSPKPVGTSLRRILGDNSLAPPTHTHIISILPENEEFFQLGDAVRFTAVISKPDGAVTLKILHDPSALTSENIETLTMDKVSTTDEKNEGDTFITVWPAVGSRASFQILCGDTQSQWRMIKILPSPAIRKISTRCKWPDYTGRGVVEQPGGRIEALAGAEVTVQAETNVAIRRALVDFEKRKKSLLMSIRNGRELRTKFRLRTNDRYRVMFIGDIIPTEGESIWYDVRVIEDKSPSVTLTQPIGDEIELAADETLRLSGEARDDFGLAHVELICLLGEQSKKVQLSKFKSPGPLGNPIDKRIEVSSLGQPGQELLCRVQVRDFRPMGIGKPTGQIGKSRQFKLRIKKPVTEPELQQGRGEPEQDQPNGKADPSQQRQNKDVQQKDGDGREKGGNEEKDDGDRDQQNGQIENTGEEVFQKAFEVARKDAEKLETLRQQLDEELNKDGQQQSREQADSSQQEIDKEQQGKQGEKKDQGDSSQQDKDKDKQQEQQKSKEQQEKKESQKQNKKLQETKKEKKKQEQKKQGQKKQESGEQKGQDDLQKQGKNESKGKSKDKGKGQQGKQDQQGQKGQQGQKDQQGQQGQKDQQGQQGQKDQQGKQGQSDSKQQGKGAGGKGAKNLYSGDGEGKTKKSYQVQTETEGDEKFEKEFSKADVKKIESLGRAIEAANKQIRDNKMDPKLLKELGMTESEFRNFVKKNTERYEKLQKKVSHRKQQAQRADVIEMIGSSEVRKGAPRAGTGNITGGPAGEGQKDRQLRQQRSRRVSSKYRKQFEAFLRSVSEEPTAQPAEPKN